LALIRMSLPVGGGRRVTPAHAMFTLFGLDEIYKYMYI
jgi:hypothetical protein